MTPRMDVDDELREIIERQPGITKQRIVNMIPTAMFVVWVLAQVWQSTDWLHTRETNEQAAKKDVEAITRVLEKVPDTYVRQDVFNQVLRRIEDRLASIDNKLEQR